MEQFIWVGKHYSEISGAEDLFVGAILVKQPLYDTKIPVYSFSDSTEKITTTSSKFINFVYYKIKSLSLKNKGYKYMFYSDTIAKKLCQLDPSIIDYFLCLNSETLSWLNFKGYTRLWLNDVIQIPPLSVDTKEVCLFENLKCKWPQNNKFVIQQDISSGGNGTYIVTKDNYKTVYNSLPEYCYYIVSPYLDTKFTMNNHIFISNSDIIISPASISNFSFYDNKQIFSGAKFTYLSRELIHIIQPNLTKIGKKLQQVGYRGVCGIDYIITKDYKFYFIEINTRFQGSSFVLNFYFSNNYGFSLQNIQLDAFKNKSLQKYSEAFNNIEINCVYDTKRRIDTRFKEIKSYIEPEITKYLFII